MEDRATHDEFEVKSPVELVFIVAVLLPVMEKACPPCAKVTVVVAVAVNCYFSHTLTKICFYYRSQSLSN